MEKELKFIIETVKDAGKIIDDSFGVRQKGEGCDLVTDADFNVEKFIIDKINREYPDFDIVSEEFNSKKEVTDNCFIIDPIDGTINFANRIPLWGIQIACRKNGGIVASVIYLPKQNELFYADKSGAYLNGKKIHVSDYRDLKFALYSVDGIDNLPIFTKMEKYSLNRRKFGAISVSYAYVACGRIHGACFKADTPWDYEPGLFLIKKAGGVVTENRDVHVGACNAELLEILEKASY